jgi:hypothetical protein
MSVGLGEYVTVRLPTNFIKPIFADRVLLALDVRAEIGISLYCCLDVPERDCPQFVGG